MESITTIQLTPNQTVFEYDDSLDDDDIPYHPGYIRIEEIEIYLLYQNSRIQVTTEHITTILKYLYAQIHGGEFDWVATETPQYDGIFGIIINRLACITNDYNHYEDYIQYLQDSIDGPVKPSNAYLRHPNFVNDEEYQLRLSHYILNTFIDEIGEDETAILFANHYGDIVNYLFYEA